MSSITLHKDLGVNPRLTFCARCKGETNEIALPGIHNHKLVCRCGYELFFGRTSQNCPACGGNNWTRKTLGNMERVPAGELCDSCKKEVTELEAAVAAGGVYFQCEKCGSSGAIRASPFATLVRERLKCPTGPCGITYSKDAEQECPACQMKKDNSPNASKEG